MFVLLATLVSHWRVLILVPMVTTALAAFIAFTSEARFTATAIFVPESSGQSRLPTNLAGLAGQFGINLAGEGSRSPAFYAEVAKSRDILYGVLVSPLPGVLPNRPPGDSVTLLELYAPEGDSALRVERALVRLDRAMTLEVDIPTGLVSLSVTDRDPEVAAAAANRAVALIDEFNTDSRQSQARRRREFIERRMSEAGADLRRAEATLDEFQDRNRAWQQSPQLSSSQARLRREVDLRQEVYLTLGRELETSRIEEVNDAPVISVIQNAVPPRLKSSPKRTVIVILGAALGVLLAVCWVGAVELLRRLRVDDEDGYRAFLDRLGWRGNSGRRGMASAAGDVAPARMHDTPAGAGVTGAGDG